MMDSKWDEPLFLEFKYYHEGNIFYFNNYEELQTFRLSKTHKMLKPFIQIKYDFERIREKHYEEIYGLPQFYLSGMIHKLPFGSSYKTFAKRAAKDLERKEHRHYIRQLLTISLNQATAELIRQNFNSRQLIERHVTNQFIQFENRKAMFGMAQGKDFQSMPEGISDQRHLVEVHQEDSNP